ncbi:MAG: hypothetical protein ACPL3Q_00810 [Candidatus Ratteibacteria bacterium]
MTYCVVMLLLNILAGKNFLPFQSTRRPKKIAAKAVNKLLDMTRSVGFGPVVEEDIED